MQNKNQEAIGATMAKLTEEEKILLGLVKHPKEKYNLTIFYMIGDSSKQ